MRPARALAASLAALLLTACPGRAKRPQGGPPVCPHDAVAVDGACRCAPGLSALEGACVGARERGAYCGASGGVAGPVTGACPSPHCAGEDAIDLATGACVSARKTRDLIAHVRPVPDDLALACATGSALVVRGDYVACLPGADTCARDADWDPKEARCVAPPACDPGSARRALPDAPDATAKPGACVPVVTREREGAAVVDLGRWMGVMLGVDGGEGDARLCRPVAQHAAALDVAPGGSMTLPITIDLVFPDNDVTQVSGRATVREVAGGGEAVQNALEALLGPLRALGGVSDAASASLRLRCTVRGGETPSLVPR